MICFRGQCLRVSDDQQYVIQCQFMVFRFHFQVRCSLLFPSRKDQGQ